MPFLSASDGVMLHYTDQGSGRPVVLIHGWTFNAEVFRRNVSELAKGHRVVTVDLRGHGRSGKEPVNWTLRQSARDVRTVVDHLGLDSVTLVGWSMGVTLIFNYLAEYGADRLAGLVFIEQTPYLLLEPDWPHAPFGSMDGAAWIGLARDLIADPATFRAGFIPACFAGGDASDAATAAEWIDQSMLTPTDAAVAYLLAMLGYDYRPMLGSIDLPVLLCYGAKSAVYPTAVGEYVHQAIPKSTVRIFDGSGHALFWEQPADFNQGLADFVDGCPARPPPE